MPKSKLFFICFFSILIIFGGCSSNKPEVAPSRRITESSEDKKIDITERKKIIIGDAHLETVNYLDAYDKILAYTDEAGGYAENISTNKHESDNTYYTVAYFTLRIPSNKYEEYKNIIFSVGKLNSLSENQQDVTGEYVTTEQQLELKKQEEQRLLIILNTSEKIEDKLLVEDRLFVVQSDISVLQTKLDNLDVDTNFCTLNITLTEVIQYKNVFSNNFLDKIVEALKNSVTNSITFFQNLILGIAYVSVPLACLSVIIFIFKKRKNNKS